MTPEFGKILMVLGGALFHMDGKHVYGEDFSTCMKKLVAEKVEDLLDIRAIRKIKETVMSGYVSAARIDGVIEK